MSAIPLPTREPTAREIIDAYLTCEGPELAPRSYTLTRRYLDQFLATFGSYPCSALRRSDLKAWLRCQTTWLAPATKKSALNRIKAAFGWAVTDERISHNPYAGLGWEDSDPRREMTDAEYAAIMAHGHVLFRRVAWFCHQTGCRPGEASALQWPMVDWANSVAVLDQHKTRKRTGQARIIYLSASVVRVLRSIETQRAPDIDYVFHSSRGGAWTSCQLSFHMRAVREAAGLADDCVLSGLRKRFVTQALVSGLDIETVRQLVGHSSIATTSKHYSKIKHRLGHLVSAAERAAGHV